MTHALSIRTDVEIVPYHADPIFAAIDRHSEAWSVFQVAPEGQASVDADAETFDALHDLLATPCATRAGMLCLIRHPPPAPSAQMPSHGRHHETR